VRSGAYNQATMRPWKQLAARRQRRAHERYLRERDRQKMLSGQDAQAAIRDISVRAGGNQQGGSLQ
jgi:hypothetical protein